MTKLSQIKLKIGCADFGGLNPLPDVRPTFPDPERDWSDRNVSLLDEDDGLFTDYGDHPGAFPYRLQDLYDRSTQKRSVDAVVLENSRLKAVFIPSLGGKLWSLFDKRAKRELLYRNSLIRPCNLAIRNAWTAGGIEWNFGFRGHSPQTCSTVHTAVTALSDGTPVLRFYWFERVRCCVVQMDIFLPERSELLYVRTRITNPNAEVVPVYWWSNIAVPQNEGDRVIVPADDVYTSKGPDIAKYPISDFRGLDMTYPLNCIIAKDFFWKTLENKPRYIAQVGKDGYGLLETSTSRLLGRKLFVWGNSNGGRNWMNYLTADNEDGSYDEIQCGLAHTQYECIPMPPHTVWEWLESYGSITADPEKTHGNWNDARAEVERCLTRKIPPQKIEELLEATRPMAKSPAEKVIVRGDGWGALELLRLEKAGAALGLMCPHLDFGPASDEQSAWVSLLTEGTVGEHDPLEAPASYMYQIPWTVMLEKAIDGKDSSNWYAHYLLGTIRLYEGRIQEARRLLDWSNMLAPNPWATYCLAVLSEKTGDREKAAEYALNAYRRLPGGGSSSSLAAECIRMLRSAKKNEQLVSFYRSLPVSLKRSSRLKLYCAFAELDLGHIEAAETLLFGPDGNTVLVVPDIREGEESVTRLWFLIQEKKGVPRDSIAEPPQNLDFRVAARSSELTD